jgi:hypothetical protein
MHPLPFWGTVVRLLFLRRHISFRVSMFSIVFGSEAQIKYIVGMSTMPKTHGTAPNCHI